NIAVALVVRKPWVVSGNVEVVKNFPFTELMKIDEQDGEDDEVTVKISKFSRSIIKVRIKNQDSSSTPEITVFACHLKSKLPSRPSGISSAYRSSVGSAISTIRRTAEATALRMMMIDHMQGQGTPTVVLGDFNDTPLSNTLNLITDQPTMTKRARGGDKSLYCTLHLQQLKSFRDVFFTHEFKNHKGMLDHILVSEEFFEHSSDAVWSHKDTRIWNDYIEDDHSYTSDHGIIKSSFV
ncbi:MAG: endonuclease/exonuclease/phosphatase family protein, partial [Gammaproteobacteria bacterium]|nr:endonuclease/exonuclease/phosphatase family protein [Gammaproteobacteria bacterium]